MFFNFKSRNIKKKKICFNEKKYSIFYQDSKSDDPNIISSILLTSNKYNLQGKPDFVLKHNKKERYIPIELKSGKIGEHDIPHTGDFLQLITYFILIEEEFGTKPKFGKLIYKDYMFIIPNRKKYKKQLLSTVKEMRQMLKNAKKKNVEYNYAMCKHCLCNNTVCEVNENG